MNSLWIEKFTDEKYSLLEKIGRTEKGLALTDTVMKAAEEDFLVRSFREFLQKFNPCVYMYMDFTNNLVTFSRYREAEIQVLGMGEGKIAQMTECIHLYEENGYYVKVARWINYLHQGKKLALNASERRDWFFDDMIRKDKCFTNQLNSLIRHPKKENMLNSFLQEFDEGIFLLRRFLYRYELYVKKKIRFSLLENESNGQLRPMDFTGRIKIAKRNQREKNQVLSEILEAMKQLPFKHRELLYWNCLLDISDAKLYETREFQTVLERVRYFYEKTMELYWECITPMVHSMFQVQKHFEEKDGFLFFTNCEAWEMVEQKNYVERFLETTNTKINKSYEIQNVVVEGMNKNVINPTRVRERFRGNEKNGKLNQNDMENAIKLQEIMRKYQLETVFHFVEDQTEDIYEFLSRDR